MAGETEEDLSGAKSSRRTLAGEANEEFWREKQKNLSVTRGWLNQAPLVEGCSSRNNNGLQRGPLLCCAGVALRRTWFVRLVRHFARRVRAISGAPLVWFCTNIGEKAQDWSKSTMTRETAVKQWSANWHVLSDHVLTCKRFGDVKGPSSRRHGAERVPTHQCFKQVHSQTEHRVARKYQKQSKLLCGYQARFGGNEGCTAPDTQP